MSAGSDMESGSDELWRGAGDVRSLCRAYDWGATPLGPPAGWPQSLRTAVRICLDAGIPMSIWAGRELILIYNDGYASLLGPERHPSALGRPARQVYAEFWDRLGPDLERVMGGETAHHEDERFVLQRGGQETEAFFTFALTPIRESEGRVVAALNTVYESTAKVRAAIERGAEARASESAARDRLAELEALYETSPVALCVFGADQRWLRINRHLADLDGRTIEEHLGKTPAEVVPDMGDKAEAMLQRVLDSGERLDVEMTGTTLAKPGVPRTFSVHWVPIKDEQGRIKAVTVAAEEITERKRIEQALRESEERFRAVLENSMDAAYRRDLRNGRYDYMSPVMERITGYSLDEAVSLSDEQVFELVHPDDLPALRDKLKLLGPSRRGVVLEYRLRCKDGNYRWLEDSAVLHVGADGRPAFRAGSVRDVSENKRAEAALHEANARLVEADQRKNEFLAVLSHELRNPLAPIRNSVYILERAAPGGEQARRALQVIDRQAQHMTRLIEDLLDVTRISRGKVKLRRERVDLCALAVGTAEDHREVFETSGVELELQTPREPVWVDGDATRLAQVIGNLLSNSAKFTQRGGSTVLAVARTARGEAEVQVRDNGAGMAPETLQHLFEPFVQAAQTIERTRGGLGLGLALVKGLVAMHGGTVAAASEGEGKGAEFTIRLPLASGLQAGAARRLGGGPAPERDGCSRRVLVVEDSIDAAESLREALVLEGHDVALAHSGPEGVEAARRFRPDVVLCDIGLPGMDGYRVARTLRDDPDVALRSTFLVALSGYALEEDVQRSKAAGFDRHIAKPPRIEAVATLLAEAPARLSAG